MAACGRAPRPGPVQEVKRADTVACVQCGQVVATKAAVKASESPCGKRCGALFAHEPPSAPAQVPYRELKRFYEVMASYERDYRVRDWLLEQVPPAISRADHTVSKPRYDRVKEDVSFLYRLVRPRAASGALGWSCTRCRSNARKPLLPPALRPGFAAPATTRSTGSPTHRSRSPRATWPS